MLGKLPGPRIGAFIPYDSSPAAFAAMLERIGFDTVAYGEHVLFRRPIMNAFVALSAAAAATERVRLLTALTLLPLYPPALAAKLASSLDFISAGRLDLGIGVGGEVPEEFEAVGVDIRTRGHQTDAAIGRLMQYFDVRTAAPDGLPDMLPKPIQQPRPPLYIGGRSSAAIDRAARLGDSWLPYLVTASQIAEGSRRLRELRAELLNDTPVGITAVVFVAADRDARRAQREGAEFVARLYRQPRTRIAKFVAAGDPNDVSERVRELIDAGASGVVLNFCAEGSAARHMAQLVGDEVVPALRAATATSITPTPPAGTRTNEVRTQ